MQGSDKAEIRTPYLLQHAYGVMIANSALGNLWVLSDFFRFIPGFAGAQDWVDAANHYLSDRMLYASSYPVRPLKQSVKEFGRFSYEPGVLENLLARNAAELFEMTILSRVQPINRKKYTQGVSLQDCKHESYK